jgi:hypothetical protein
LTLLVRGESVTVPVLWSIRPDEADAMLSTNDGSWKRTGPDGREPPRVRDTEPGPDEILRFSLLPEVVGKLVTEMGGPPLNHWAGMPRPTTREPPERCATSESNRTLLAWAIPQAWGEAPWPVAGCRPIHGVRVDGADELSHQEYGPLWLLAIMNS